MNKPVIPDSKQIQYDRQLRLWGDHGQKALESGRVCLIGADSLGTEILKSLVLPGLGSFTIIDHRYVTQADCGSNFFVHESMINESRARVTCELLRKLNPDVNGNYIDKPSIDDLLKQNTFDFTQFNVVITANLPYSSLTVIANHLWSLKVPLLVARSYGFIGTLNLQVSEHYVIEAHPDDVIPDLRLDYPINSFRQYCDAIDLNTITREDHLHLPSIVLLYKTLQIWQKKNNQTNMPTNRKEKDEFKQILEELSNHPAYEANDHHRSLENFDEAKRTMPSRLVRTIIPSSVRDLFTDPRCLELSNQSDIFWFIVHAIKLFSENEGHGFLPVRGEVPDMITNTSSFVNIVKIYQEQAKHDCEIVQNYLITLLRKQNRLSNMTSDEETVLHELVHLYCKNSSFLRVIRTPCIKDEVNTLSQQIQQFSGESFSDESESDFYWYVGLRLCDIFYEKYNRYPGEALSFNGDNLDNERQKLENDCNDLKQISKENYVTLSNASASSKGSVPEKFLEELCRYGASEIHSISAFIGGCCAQEAIKLITHQYVPANNILIYNGIRETTSVYRL